MKRCKYHVFRRDTLEPFIVETRDILHWVMMSPFRDIVSTFFIDTAEPDYDKEPDYSDWVD